MEVLEQIMSIIGKEGIAVVIILYFLFKDYKFNEQIIGLLGEVKEVLTELKTWHATEDK